MFLKVRIPDLQTTLWGIKKQSSVKLSTVHNSSALFKKKNLPKITMFKVNVTYNNCLARKSANLKRVPKQKSAFYQSDAWNCCKIKQFRHLSLSWGYNNVKMLGFIF